MNKFSGGCNLGLLVHSWKKPNKSIAIISTFTVIPRFVSGKKIIVSAQACRGVVNNLCKCFQMYKLIEIKCEHQSYHWELIFNYAFPLGSVYGFGTKRQTPASSESASNLKILHIQCSQQCWPISRIVWTDFFFNLNQFLPPGNFR